MQAYSMSMHKAAETVPRPEWTRRFAYRAMLVLPALDTVSALMIAEGQFDEACDLQPEEAAEIYGAQE